MCTWKLNTKNWEFEILIPQFWFLTETKVRHLNVAYNKYYNEYGIIHFTIWMYYCYSKRGHSAHLNSMFLYYWPCTGLPDLSHKIFGVWRNNQVSGNIIYESAALSPKFKVHHWTSSWATPIHSTSSHSISLRSSLTSPQLSKWLLSKTISHKNFLWTSCAPTSNVQLIPP